MKITQGSKKFATTLIVTFLTLGVTTAPVHAADRSNNNNPSGRKPAACGQQKNEGLKLGHFKRVGSLAGVGAGNTKEDQNNGNRKDGVSEQRHAGGNESRERGGSSRGEGNRRSPRNFGSDKEHNRAKSNISDARVAFEEAVLQANEDFQNTLKDVKGGDTGVTVGLTATERADRKRAIQEALKVRSESFNEAYQEYVATLIPQKDKPKSRKNECETGNRKGFDKDRNGKEDRGNEYRKSEYRKQQLTHGGGAQESRKR
jgi:hypothetical protein